MQTGTMLSEGRLGRAQRLCTSARNGGKGRCRPANKCIRAAQRFHSSSEASSSDSTRGERRSVPERCRVKVLQGLAAATTSHLGVSHAAQADAIESIQAGSQLIQKDSIIAVAFGTAILALGAVTIGVVYLSALTWNDKRTEKAERASFEQALKDRESRAAEDTNRPIKKRGGRKKELVTQGEKKGFGR